MLVAKYFLVVTLFVFTLKTAQSFILLTANVADIKKIAQKFVSDEMADKLAHTVVEVIGNLHNKKGSNINEELKKIEVTTEENIEMFKDEKYESNDMFSLNKGNDQQRFKKATRTPDEEITLDDSGEVQSIYKDGYQKRTSKYLNNWEMNIKSQDTKQLSSKEEPKKSIFAEMKSVNHQQRPKPNLDSRTTRRPVVYTIRTTRQTYRNYESNEVKSHYVPQVKPILGSELTHRNKKVYDNSPASDQNKQKRSYRFESSGADDEEQYQIKSNQNQSNRKPVRKPAWDNQEAKKVTPKREKYEFDQYDNLNYPKMGAYVATSGPVALSVVPTDKQWWEKDLPNRRKMQK